MMDWGGAITWTGILGGLKKGSAGWGPRAGEAYTAGHGGLRAIPESKSSLYIF